MMKLLIPVLSFLLGNAKSFFKEPSVALSQKLVLHIRSIGLLITGCIGSLALFCVGFSLFISQLATQFDSAENFYFSAGMTIYLFMTVICGAVLIYCLRRRTWLDTMGFGESDESKKTGALESAVALLVMDYVEERQSRRQNSSEKEQAV